MDSATGVFKKTMINDSSHYNDTSQSFVYMVIFAYIILCFILFLFEYNKKDSYGDSNGKPWQLFGVMSIGVCILFIMSTFLLNGDSELTDGLLPEYSNETIETEMSNKSKALMVGFCSEDTEVSGFDDDILTVTVNINCDNQENLDETMKNLYDNL